MNLHGNILEYFYKHNGIPLWILTDDGRLIYSSLAAEKLLASGAPAKFLSYFTRGDGQGVGNASENGRDDSAGADGSRRDGQGDAPSVVRVSECELYAVVRFTEEGRGFAAVAGPAFDVHPLSETRKTSLSLDYLLRREAIKAELMFMPTTPVADFCDFAAALAELFLGRPYDGRLLESGIGDHSLKHILDRQLIGIIFDAREDERLSVYAPEVEEEYLSCIRRGDVDAFARSLKLPTVRDPSARGTPNQFLFETVAMVTLATRAAIEGGLDPVQAYSLSDLYLKQLSRVRSDKEIAAIARQIFPHFAERVRLAHSDCLLEKSYSPYIVRSIQYVRTHLHYPITLEEVAAELGINPKYLSRLFITCHGEKFSSYVQRERIAEAKALLENTDKSIVEISNSLGFSSQSYFIKVFTKYAGLTPGQFLAKKKGSF